MSLKLYNSLKRKKELFVPMVDAHVGMYVCGPTVYDICHMGHARATIVFDVVARYFKFSGYSLTYVRNITDIDDKIINKAKAEKVDFKVITERYIKSFHDDMIDLGNEPPTIEPRATEHIDDIIAIIEKLMEKGLAYQVSGDVYYSVEKFSEYGKLSGRKTDDLVAGARVEVDERKKNPLDFALWKSSKEGEPWWHSPWGNGRPGWHIECSAMSCNHLGESFDIHGGGKDLIFPHHENEVAQSEGAHGKAFAKYWMHNGFVNINKEKMSKSLGNFFTIRELLGLYHPEVLRFFLLSTHYRSPIDYTEQNLKEAEAGLEKIYTTLNAMDMILGEKVSSEGSAPREGEGPDAEAEEMVNSLEERFRSAMDDDFNTALATASFFDTVRAINGWINSASFVRNEKTLDIIRTAREALVECASVLGVLQVEPAGFLEALQAKRAGGCKVDTNEIESLVDQRWDARIAKDWKRSDEIRDKLADMGVVLKDSAEGTSWEFAA
ncbi:MAG: cysteine--tRNA ligase [Proteobacteria bacterium]|nr:cysteine--tRNA ligase [Pseudomonadota bacterium]